MPDVLNAQGSSVDLGTYVIDPEEIIDTLDAQYSKYASLPLDLARKSDDICIQRYGLTNSQLYNNLKAKMLDNAIDPDAPKIIGVREDFELPIGYDDIDDIECEEVEDSVELIEKIEKAKDMQSSTCVIIYPLSSIYPFNLDDLEELFSRFNFLSFDLQKLSDQECFKLFGYDNRNMYAINKAKLLAKEKHKEELDPMEIDSYFNAVSTIGANESVDLLGLLEKKLDIVNIKRNGTLYESVIADYSGLSDIDSAIHLRKTASIAVPEFTPYLIPTEIEQLVGDGTGLSTDEREFLELYKNSLAEGMRNFDSKKYFDTIKSLYETKSQNKSQTDIIYTRMEAFGWNPNLPFNRKSFEGARSRICNYIDEFYNPTIVDVSAIKEDTINNANPNDKLNIIYFVDVNDGDKYLAFTHNIMDLYGKNQIKSIQISDDSKVSIYASFVTPEIYNLIFEKARDPLYQNSISKCFDVFSDTDNDKVKGTKFLVLLSKLSNGEVVSGAKVFKLFNDEWKNFTVSNIRNLINSIKTVHPELGELLYPCPIDEAVLKLYKNKSIAYLKNLICESSEVEGNVILKEMKELFTPSIALTEAKNIPIRINDKGVVVDLPTIIEEEYQTVHKSLLVYDEKKNYEAMKDSLAHLWYLNLLCERKITKWKDKEKKQQQLKISRDIRARILNDFKKYLKKVIENDPEFDFVAYFKKSRWNDRSIFIDAQTLKYTGRIIAAIVKSLIKKK